MHAGAVVAEERLGHEGHGLARAPCDVLDDVLELHDVVAGVQQRVEAVVDLLLTGGAHLVVRALEVKANFAEHRAHLVAKVGELVAGAHGEVAALVARLVAAVGGAVLFVLDAGVPPGLGRVDVVVTLVLVRVEAHGVEDEELGLGREERGVADARGLQVLHGLGRNVARVARVRLVRERVHDREVDDERLGGAERVDVRRCHVGQQLHVGLVDGLETTDRRTVEHGAIVEYVLGELAMREC